MISVRILGAFVVLVVASACPIVDTRREPEVIVTTSVDEWRTGVGVGRQLSVTARCQWETTCLDDAFITSVELVNAVDQRSTPALISATMNQGLELGHAYDVSGASASGWNSLRLAFTRSAIVQNARSETAELHFRNDSFPVVAGLRRNASTPDSFDITFSESVSGSIQDAVIVKRDSVRVQCTSTWNSGGKSAFVVCDEALGEGFWLEIDDAQVPVRNVDGGVFSERIERFTPDVFMSGEAFWSPSL